MCMGPRLPKTTHELQQQKRMHILIAVFVDNQTKVMQEARADCSTASWYYKQRTTVWRTGYSLTSTIVRLGALGLDCTAPVGSLPLLVG